VDEAPAFGLLHVEGDALLVAVVRLEVEVGPIGEIQPTHAQDAPTRIPGLPVLDLDDLGSEIPE